MWGSQGPKKKLKLYTWRRQAWNLHRFPLAPDYATRKQLSGLPFAKASKEGFCPFDVGLIFKATTILLHIYSHDVVHDLTLPSVLFMLFACCSSFPCLPVLLFLYATPKEKNVNYTRQLKYGKIIENFYFKLLNYINFSACVIK